LAGCLDGGVDWLVGWLAGWLVGWLAGWLVGWLAGWLVGWFNCLLLRWCSEGTLCLTQFLNSRSANEHFTSTAIDKFVRIVHGKNFLLDVLILHHSGEE